MSDLRRDRSKRTRRSADTRGSAASDTRDSADTRAADARAAGVARHGRLPHPRPWATVLKVVAGALAVVLVSGASVGAIAAYQVTSDIGDGVVLNAAEGETTKAVPPSIGEYEGGFNILVVGTDNDTSKTKGPSASGTRPSTT